MRRNRARRSVLDRVLIASITALAAPAVWAAEWEWTAVALTDMGQTTYASAFGAGNGQQVGVLRGPDGDSHAALWSGSSASWVDLHPAGVSESFSAANATSGVRQAGYIGLLEKYACIWSGTAASYVSLHPAAGLESEAMDIAGNQQVGWAFIAGTYRAVRWTGTAASLFSLHPSGASRSYALGTDGTFQCGYAVINNLERAGMWSGTPASWINLQPFPNEAESRACAVGDGQQVGGVEIGFNNYAAALWSGSAASYVNLRPNFAADSFAWDVKGGMQVGYVRQSGGPRQAVIWNGTAQSVIYLAQYLPQGYGPASEARSIWIDQDGVVYVAGYAIQGTTEQAVLWIRMPATPCPGDTNGDDIVDFNDLNTLLSEFNQVLTDPQADFDGDGDVDFADLNTLLGAYNQPCA